MDKETWDWLVTMLFSKADFTWSMKSYVERSPRLVIEKLRFWSCDSVHFLCHQMTSSELSDRLLLRSPWKEIETSWMFLFLWPHLFFSFIFYPFFSQIQHSSSGLQADSNRNLMVKMGPQDQTQRKKHVVIVGAGAAGMVGAMRRNLCNEMSFSEYRSSHARQR